MALHSYHLYRILIIGGSRSRKTSMIFNLIKHQQPDIDKMYFYVTDPFESKHQLLINNSRKKVGITILKNSKGSADYSQTVDDVYENFEDYNPTRKGES